VAVERVLVVDDEPDICELVKDLLGREGFKVESTLSSEGILKILENFKPDLVLVDFMLPGGGLEMINLLRAHPTWKNLSIIVITGADAEIYKVEALDSGADDYVVKPFSAKELSARIRAVLRRSQAREKGDEVQTDGPEVLKTEGLVMDLKSHRVLKDGTEVYLTLTEFRILSELLKRQGNVLSRDQLREKALGNFNVTDRTIDVHMASLRKKLDRYSNYIHTIRGVGYRYN
jgi:two-component system phosphate regulon response regulator PhoB